MESKHNNPAGRNCGKGVSHRLQEIDDKFKKSGGIFKEYKIGELFEKLSLKFKGSNFNKNRDLSTSMNKEFNLPLVNAKHGNNGIMYYGREKEWEYAENTIDIVNDGAISTGDVYPQPQKTGILYNAYLIKPKFTLNNSDILIYFSTVIKKSIKTKYGYDKKASWNRVKNNTIFLPTLNNELAFEYMEERIRELESERIRELEAYLQATGLNNYILDENARGGVKRLIENKIELKDYRIEDLFTVKSSKKKFNANNINITNDYNLHPYVARGSSNNGIKGYISEDTEFLNDENTLAFGQDTATCFYQDKPYFTGDKIKILSPINFTLNSHIGLYIISSMKKTLKHLSWGQNSFNEDFIKNIKIKLPIKNNNIDFNYMEQLIKTLEKIIIKDVIDFKDKIIETHKEICKI